MSVDRFNALKERVEALVRGERPTPGLFERALRFFSREPRSAALEPLRTLDAELERAGVHTVADARLLQQLGAERGRLGELSKGLAARAEEVLGLFEATVDELERRAALEPLTAPLRLSLERDFQRLARVVKVAAVFSGGGVAFEIFTRPRGRDRAAAPAQARLALAEFLAQRAGGQLVDVARRRRDLDLAYELVLRMGADASQDRDRLRALRVELGAARERVRAMPVVRSFDELFRHVRHAMHQDPPAAWRALRSLYERAVEAEQPELARAAWDAAMSLTTPRGLERAVEHSAALRNAGWRQGYQTQLQGLAPGGRRGLDDELAARLAALAFELDDDQRRALELASGCARFFDVEDVLSEELLEVETRTRRPRQQRVPYPTQLMTYETTHSLDQLNHFVLDRPGMLVLDLASGRQLVRTYLEEAPTQAPRKIQKTAVRVYVLDASGSMHGARARFRDAILISELNAIRVKASAGLPFDPLYFSYFNDTPTELERIDSGDAATRRLEKTFAKTPAEGQTDITLALISAFESIARARGRDPYLARATVVLVTDGEDGIDVELIEKARRPVEGVEVSFSFISLGEENADLRSIVLKQREQGERAFYHHLSDAEIQLARTEFDSGWRTLLPPELPVSRDTLEQLMPHLAALERIAAGLALEQPTSSDAQFDVFFPERQPLRGRAPAQLERVIDVLDAVGEAVALSPVDARRGEAVTLVTHLLGVYAVPLADYLSCVQLAEPRVEKAVARLRLVC